MKNTKFQHHYTLNPSRFCWTPNNHGQLAKIIMNIHGTPKNLRVFFEVLCNHLLTKGYKRSHAGKNVYSKSNKGELIILAVTIEDFTVAVSTINMYKALLTDLK